MTVIDLLIIGVVCYALVVFNRTRERLTTPGTRLGFAGIVVGLSLVALFYVADLLTMHVVPLFIPVASAMELMQDLHLNHRWSVAFFGVGSIALGLAAASRATLALIEDLEKSRTDLQEELSLRRETEQARRDSEERFRAVVNNSPTKIHIKDAEGRYILVNKEAEKLFGVTDEEARGKTTHEIFPEEQADVFRKHDRAVLETGETIEQEERWKRDDGVRTYLTVKFPIRDSDGEIEAIGAIGTDITERKQEERVLGEAKEQAELANRAKSEFLTNMSHELRTPLNAIIGFSEIIGHETLGPVGNSQYKGYGHDIHNAGRHLLDLINDILDLSKVESGMDELHEEEVAVEEVADSVIRLLQERALKAGVALTKETLGDLPVLYADERKLKQVFANLLSNAVKFTEAGGRVTLRISCSRDSGYVFQVSDTGIGMAPDDIPKALSLFGQVDGQLSRKQEGTGLGLPLTKALAELHGGSLKLESEAGAGTIVTVRFPAERIVPSQCDAKAVDAADRKAG